MDLFRDFFIAFYRYRIFLYMKIIATYVMLYRQGFQITLIR